MEADSKTRTPGIALGTLMPFYWILYVLYVISLVPRCWCVFAITQNVSLSTSLTMPDLVCFSNCMQCCFLPAFLVWGPHFLGHLCAHPHSATQRPLTLVNLTTPRITSSFHPISFPLFLSFFFFLYLTSCPAPAHVGTRGVSIVLADNVSSHHLDICTQSPAIVVTKYWCLR